MVRSRFIGSGRLQEGGFLATHKQDFQVHVDGTDWRHTADQIDMNDPLPRPFTAPNVQETLEKMVSIIGQGFVTIGDGYDGSGGLSQPDLYDDFQVGFANARIQKGGIIVVKSGDYIVRQTVVVPAGITIFAEPNGARITSEVVGGPAFRFLASTDVTNIGDGTNAEVQTKQTRMWNITLFDNKYGDVASGGPSSPGRPLVEIAQGANVLLDGCMFVGRYLGSGGAVTTSAVAVSGTPGPAVPTILNVQRCFFDVVSTAIDFNPSLTTSAELRVEQCRARTITTATSDAFVKTCLGKVFVHGNYHISFTPSGSTIGGLFVNLVAPGVADINSFLSLIGNQGGLRIPDLASTVSLAKSNFLVDNRGVQWAFRLLDTSNSWGSVNSNAWYITVGDGTNSAGDFTGPDALERVNDLSNPELTALFSHTEQTVIVNPGEYTMTKALKISKLIGNVSPNETVGLSKNVIINLNSDVEVYASGVYDNFVGQAQNITFNAVSHFQRVYSNLTEVQDSEIFKNCSFYNVSAYVENFESSVIVGCKFHQDGTYPDQVGLVISSDNLSKVDFCIFTGYGYALSQSSWGGTAILSNCIFDQYLGTPDDATPRIRNVDPIYTQTRYIGIGRFTSKVLVDNISVKSGRFVASPTMLANLPIYMSVESDSGLTIRDSVILGPDQIYADSSPVITCFVVPDKSASIRDNQFTGAEALHVSGFVSSGGRTMGAELVITGNQIKHYIATMNYLTTAFVVDISKAGGLFYANCDGYDGYNDGYSIDGYDGYDGYTVDGYMDGYGADGYGLDGYIPVTEQFNGQLPFSSAYITNNRVIGFCRAGGFAAHQFITSAYIHMGLCQIYAPGWSVNFESNDVVYVSDDAVLPDGKTSQSAVVIYNSGGMPTFTKTSFKNNGLYHKCDGYAGQALSTAYVSTDILQMQGNNLLTWYCDDGYDGNLERSYVRMETHRTGSLIQNNTFNSNTRGTVTKPILIDGYSDGYGAISENYFDSFTPDRIKFGDTLGHWLLTDRNYTSSRAGYLVRVDF